MKPDSRQETYRRLARRNLGALLTYKFLHEYGYDKGQVVAEAIVADICRTIERYWRREGDLEPGQVIYPAPALGERGGRGKTIAETELVPVRLTLVAQVDIEALAEGIGAQERREMRIRRITTEAHRQGAALSQLDVALLLGLTAPTVGRYVRRARARGEFLPLRGYLADLGSWPTHKAAVVRLYLEGLTTPEIARRTYHSKEAVDRYIRGFERIRLLAPKYAREELPLLAGMSPRLIDEYLGLIEEFGLLPRSEEVIAHGGGS